MTTIIRLERIYLSTRTLGSLYDDDQLIAKTLELPWIQNKKGISCIPEGVYPVTKENPIPQFEGDRRRPRPYKHFRVHKTGVRAGILIHRGIRPEHSKGCILPGSRFLEINTDAPILGDSVVKLTWLVDNLPDEFKLQIIKKP